MKLIKLLIFSIFIVSCTPRETITADSAKNDTISLLNDLKIDYKGVHCVLNNSQLATCKISTSGDFLTSRCYLYDCELIEKNALRVKFGIVK